MRLSAPLLTLSTVVLGLGLMLGCRPTVSTSTEATAASPTASPTASPAANSTASPTLEEASATSQSSSGTDTTATQPVAQATQEVPPAVFAESGVAIRGADPVAYFTESRYVPGSADHTYEWANVTWQFSSAENRDLFAGRPEQYAPQYGGFCAWAVSEGYTASVDPNAWEIVDGKLYLNYDARIQRRWQRDIPGNIARANDNWPGVLN